jgi:hypothetical protein
VGEHFYGLKRTTNHRLRSLIFSVFLPYVKVKLDALHEQMRTSNNNNNRHAAFYIILQILPKIEVGIISFNKGNIAQTCVSFVFQRYLWKVFVGFID